MQNPSDLTPMMLEYLTLQNLLKRGTHSRSERAKLTYLNALYENALTLALTQKSAAIQISLAQPMEPPTPPSPPAGPSDPSVN